MTTNEGRKSKAYVPFSYKIMIPYLLLIMITEIFVNHVPHNTAANRLYKSLGFQETGEMEDGEVVLSYYVKRDIGDDRLAIGER